MRSVVVGPTATDSYEATYVNISDIIDVVGIDVIDESKEVWLKCPTDMIFGGQNGHLQFHNNNQIMRR